MLIVYRKLVSLNVSHCGEASSRVVWQHVDTLKVWAVGSWIPANKANVKFTSVYIPPKNTLKPYATYGKIGIFSETIYLEWNSNGGWQVVKKGDLPYTQVAYQHNLLLDGLVKKVMFLLVSRESCFWLKELPAPKCKKSASQRSLCWNCVCVCRFSECLNQLPTISNCMHRPGQRLMTCKS